MLDRTHNDLDNVFLPLHESSAVAGLLCSYAITGWPLYFPSQCVSLIHVFCIYINAYIGDYVNLFGLQQRCINLMYCDIWKKRSSTWMVSFVFRLVFPLNILQEILWSEMTHLIDPCRINMVSQTVYTPCLVWKQYSVHRSYRIDISLNPLLPSHISDSD